MDSTLELHYLRDGSRWALDAELRERGTLVHHWGRLYLEVPGEGSFESLVEAFAKAYAAALAAGDRAGSNLTQASGVTSVLREHVLPAAQKLGACLLPAALEPWLAQARPLAIEIVCDADLTHVPFEAAWWHGDFLGFRFAVSRRLIVRQRGATTRLAVSTPPRCALVGDPGNQLNAGGQRTSGTVVKTQLEQLRDGWNEIPNRSMELPVRSCSIGRDVTAEQLNHWLITHDLLVLLAHHEADRRDPETRALLGHGRGVEIGPGRFYSGTDLFAALPPGSRVPWLVCWPCCHSGTGEAWRLNWREEVAHDTAHGLADAALRRGVPHFIGTLFEVHAEFVAGFVGPLLEALDQGHSVGEALRRARCALREGAPADPFHAGTLPGLAFLHLGESASALVSAGGVRLDQTRPSRPEIRWCRATDEATLCGRAIAPQEPGHGECRCVHHHQPQPPLPVRCAANHLAAADELKLCTFPGCTRDYCPRCRTHRFQSCWRHASASEPLVTEDQGTVCVDPFHQHPDEPRTVHFEEAGFSRSYCRDCWAEYKRRLAR